MSELDTKDNIKHRRRDFFEIERQLEAALSPAEMYFVMLFVQRGQQTKAGNDFLEAIKKPGLNIECGIFIYGLKRELLKRNPELAKNTADFPPYEDIDGDPGPDGLTSKEVGSLLANREFLDQAGANKLWLEAHNKFHEKITYNPFVASANT